MPYLPTKLSLNNQTKVRKLARKKYRDEFREYILEGARLVREAIQPGAAEVRFILVEEERAASFTGMLQAAGEQQIPVYTIPATSFNSLTDTEHSQGIMAVAAMPADPGGVLRDERNHAVTLLHEVNDPGNLGAILRTSDWFGAGAMLLSPGSADPYNPKAVRASMGSILRARIELFDEYDAICAESAKNGYAIFAADARARVSLFDIRFPERVIFMFGSEAHGIPDDVLQRADTVFAIPRFGAAESLNLAASHAAVLSEYRRQCPPKP